MEIGGKDDLEFACNTIFDRITFAPLGREGGGAGAAGRVEQKSGVKMRPKGFQVIPTGDRLMLYMPGGGGMGPAVAREPEKVARDVRDGLVSAANARDIYRVVVNADGSVDFAETSRLRN
jgi:N-methylhydantoinase B